MKNKVFVLLILCISMFSAFCQEEEQIDSIPKVSFEALLDSTNMVFVVPEDYIEVDPIFNIQMNYEKAYKHPTEKFEVRYAIRMHEFNWHMQMI